MKRLQPRESLPTVTDTPKSAFLCGWWSGLAVGALNGIGFVFLLKGLVR